MRKFTFLFLCFIVLSGIFVSSSSADLFVYDGAGVNVYDGAEYETPAGWYVEEYGSWAMGHSSYWTLGIRDFGEPVSAINLVFHGIYNESPWPQYPAMEGGINYLEIVFFDNATHLGRLLGSDTNLPYPAGYNYPDWSAYGATSLGIWSDIDGPESVDDVVFTVDNPALLSYISNGGTIATFGFGIDPDCSYKFDSLTVETPVPPVPEPATMLLLGSGLVGLVGFGRKRFFKKG